MISSCSCDNQSFPRVKLGPILFLMYTTDLLRLIERHGLHPHGCADDTKIYSFCSTSITHSLQEQISACIDDVALYMSCNQLQLNISLVLVELTATSDSSVSGSCRRRLCHNVYHRHDLGI